MLSLTLGELTPNTLWVSVRKGSTASERNVEANQRQWLFLWRIVPNLWRWITGTLFIVEKPMEKWRVNMFFSSCKQISFWQGSHRLCQNPYVFWKNHQFLPEFSSEKRFSYSIWFCHYRFGPNTISHVFAKGTPINTYKQERAAG